MQSARKLPDLIEDIYDAGLDPARWSDVVVNIRDFVGGSACGLLSKNSISKFGVTHYYCGVDPHYIQLYSDTHSQFDPLRTLPRFGNVVSIPDLVSYDEYRRGRFYQEWLKPQGCIDVVNVVIEKSNPSCPIVMAVLPGKRMMDVEMRKRIEAVVPHAHRAVMITKSLESRQSESAALSDVLDGLNAGIFLLDSSCRILHANLPGRGMLEADDFLRSSGGQFAVRDQEINRTLRELFAAGGNVTRAANGRAWLLTAHDGERYVAQILPLKSVARNGARGPSKAVGALFVRKIEPDAQSFGASLAGAFRLTPSELRVLMSIVEGGGVPEASQTLGIAETTVKTHLHRVFAKTGASRQTWSSSRPAFPIHCQIEAAHAARLNGATSMPLSFSALRTPRAISTAAGLSP
jgi:DNA-binding NarL/FixJ family response regulator